LVRIKGFRVKGKRKFKPATDSNHSPSVAPNWGNKQFKDASSNIVWGAYIQTLEGGIFIRNDCPSFEVVCRLKFLVTAQRHRDDSRGEVD
jgi:hypothetical protein